MENLRKLAKKIAKKFPAFTWKTYIVEEQEFISINSSDFLKSSEYLVFWKEVLFPYFLVSKIIPVISESEPILKGQNPIDKFEAVIIDNKKFKFSSLYFVKMNQLKIVEIPDTIENLSAIIFESKAKKVISVAERLFKPVDSIVFESQGSYVSPPIYREIQNDLFFTFEMPTNYSSKKLIRIPDFSKVATNCKF